MKKLKMIFFNDYKFYDYNSGIHIDFISEMQKKYDILEYGKPSGKFDNFAEKGSAKQFKDIYNTFKPDFFLSYNSNGSTKGKRNYERFSWLKKIYKNYDTPKFHITTDHCRDEIDEKQNSWFKDYGITCALFRHKNYEKNKIGIPCEWLPFSVKREVYLDNTIEFSKKKDKISFVGSTKHKVYKPRRDAINFLTNKGLISKPAKKVVGPDYCKFMSSHIAGITCGSTKNFFVAKYLEILASGSFLLCSKTDGLEVIPDEYYMLYDSKNMQDFYDKYIDFISNKKRLKSIIKESQNFVLVKHCHKKRIRQFDKIIKKNL